MAPEKVTASFFEQPSKTWWGQGFTWQSHAEGYFVLRHGELRLVLSTGSSRKKLFSLLFEETFNASNVHFKHILRYFKQLFVVFHGSQF